MLQSLFAAVGAPAPAFASIASIRAAGAIDFLARLPTEQRQTLLSLFADVRMLSDELGVQCMRDAGPPDVDIITTFSTLRSNHDRAAWMRLHRPARFDEALTRRFFDQRSVSPTLSTAFATPEDAKRQLDVPALEAALSATLAEDFGRAPQVKVEPFSTDGRDLLLSATFEGYWVTGPEFNDAGELTTRAAPAMHEAAIKIAPGLLTVVTSNTSVKRRRAIARCAAQHALGLDGELIDLPPIQYELKRLLDPKPFKFEGEHRGEVFVTMLELSSPTFGAVTKLYRHRGRDLCDVRGLALSDLRSSDRAFAQVVAAEICVVFEPAPARPKGCRVRARFSGGSCSMRHIRQEDDLVHAYYLKHWELMSQPRGRAAP